MPKTVVVVLPFKEMVVGSTPTGRTAKDETGFMPVLSFVAHVGVGQDRCRERKVLSRGGRFETARFQGETILLVCESKLF